VFFVRHALSASHRPQDVYLYYFLLRYPGRTLVFMSSIDGIRRLAPLLELLGLPTFPLHSQLEQRQRLKNLDRCVPRRCLVLSVVNIARHQLQVTCTLYPARD
jgi:ATP-dependent RNA helicase DDX24/MAK5